MPRPASSFLTKASVLGAEEPSASGDDPRLIGDEPRLRPGMPPSDEAHPAMQQHVEINKTKRKSHIIRPHADSSFQN